MSIVSAHTLNFAAFHVKLTIEFYKVCKSSFHQDCKDVLTAILCSLHTIPETKPLTMSIFMEIQDNEQRFSTYFELYSEVFIRFAKLVSYKMDLNPITF